MDAKKQNGTVICDLNPCYGLKWVRGEGGYCEGEWPGRSVMRERKKFNMTPQCVQWKVNNICIG